MLYILAILCPPLAVAMANGDSDDDWFKLIAFGFCIFLCMLGWVPGLIYALLTVAQRNKKVPDGEQLCPESDIRTNRHTVESIVDVVSNKGEKVNRQIKDKRKSCCPRCGKPHGFLFMFSNLDNILCTACELKLEKENDAKENAERIAYNKKIFKVIKTILLLLGILLALIIIGKLREYSVQFTFFGIQFNF